MENVTITSFNISSAYDEKDVTVNSKSDKSLPFEQEKALKSWFKNIRACYALAVGYTSIIGGSCTLTGTPPNLLTKDIADGYVVHLCTDINK